MALIRRNEIAIRCFRSIETDRIGWIGIEIGAHAHATARARTKTGIRRIGEISGDRRRGRHAIIPRLFRRHHPIGRGRALDIVKRNQARRTRTIRIARGVRIGIGIAIRVDRIRFIVAIFAIIVEIRVVRVIFVIVLFLRVIVLLGISRPEVEFVLYALNEASCRF